MTFVTPNSQTVLSLCIGLYLIASLPASAADSMPDWHPIHIPSNIPHDPSLFIREDPSFSNNQTQALHDQIAGRHQLLPPPAPSLLDQPSVTSPALHPPGESQPSKPTTPSEPEKNAERPRQASSKATTELRGQVMLTRAAGGPFIGDKVSVSIFAASPAVEQWIFSTILPTIGTSQSTLSIPASIVPIKTVTTSSDGHFRISDLPPDTYFFVASIPLDNKPSSAVSIAYGQAVLDRASIDTMITGVFPKTRR